MHSLGTLEVLALIHGQATCSTSKTVSFGSKFASVTIFTEELTFVLGAVRGIEKFTAKTAFEAHFVPFESTSNAFLCGVDRFAAFRAFWMFDWFERHVFLLYTYRVYIDRRRKKDGVVSMKVIFKGTPHNLHRTNTGFEWPSR